MDVEVPLVLPASPTTFAHPPLVHWLAVSSIAACAAGCLFALVLPFLLPDEDHRLLVTSCLVVFGGSLYLSLAIVRRCGDTIAVTNDGLWRHCPNGPSLFIGWNEIADVQVQNILQRLVVRDSTGTCAITLEYHLENFGTLRAIVRERAPRQAVDFGG